MIVKCRVPVLDNGVVKLLKGDFKELCNIEQIKNTEVLAMGIDASTTCTGISLVDNSNGSLLASIALVREKTGETKETKIQYKVKLKRVLTEVFVRNTNIKKVFYEEPFIEFVNSASALLALRTSVEEIIAENEPLLNYIEYKEIGNKTWKSRLLAPEKCPVGTELEKEAVKNKIVSNMPFMEECTQDELDAYGVAFVGSTLMDAEDFKKKNYPKFVYNIEFIGADDDDEFFELLTGEVDSKAFKIPKKLVDNGVRIREIGNSGKFETHIFNSMAGDDVILAIKFKSTHHGNIVLKYRLGHLTQTYKYIYAVIWRKSRKTN